MKDEHDCIYVWEESFFDEDGQLWVVTMLSLLMLPIHEEMVIQPMLLEPLRTLLKRL
jgi:hypothetical protein